MAHPIETKAQAYALFRAGYSVAEVVKAVGVPKQTASRWKKQAYAKYLKPLAKRLRFSLFRFSPQAGRFDAKRG